MYIKYNNKNYSCACDIGGNSITYRHLPEDFPSEVNGQIVLYADDNFKLREDNTDDYLRQIFSDNTLTLTNTLETTPMPKDNTPSAFDQIRADIDYLALMTGVDL